MMIALGVILVVVLLVVISFISSNGGGGYDEGSEPRYRVKETNVKSHGYHRKNNDDFMKTYNPRDHM